MNIRRSIFIFITLLLCLIALPVSSYGSRLYVLGAFENQQISTSVDEIARTFGLEVIRVKSPARVEGGAKNAPIALIASARGISEVRKNDLAGLLRMVESGALNLLIVYEGAKGESVPIATDVQAQKVKLQKGTLAFSKYQRSELNELAGVRLPVVFKDDAIFLEQVSKDKKEWQRLGWVVGSESASESAWLLRRKYGSGAVYVTTSAGVELAHRDELFTKAPSILAIAILIKNTYGERVWHRQSNQANLTIDDPWLREPYGNLSYPALLAEMEKENFHTTIAFVPWNYNRSENGVVEIFQKNRKRYSICVHGNNHDTHEFHQYDKHALNEQENDIRQALARMERFKENTGIDYSRVMVFPRGIAPAETIALLNKYGFAASANFNITPLGSLTEYSIKDMITPASLKYYKFPLLKRYPPSVDKNIIALMMYFRKPIVMHTHQGFFADGIGSFNAMAHLVNEKSSVSMEWTNLTKVSEGLYMEKQRDDGAYDIWMMSRRIVINNHSRRVKRIALSKLSQDIEKVNGLIVGDKIYREDINAELKRLREVKPGGTLQIGLIIKDQDIQANNSTQIEDSSLKVKLIRAISDFRDIYMSRNRVGRAIIDWYYGAADKPNGY